MAYLERSRLPIVHESEAEMDRKILAWNKNNIEIAVADVERVMTEADEEDRNIYGWIRAILWALGFILDEMEKRNSNETRRHK